MDQVRITHVAMHEAHRQEAEAQESSLCLFCGICCRGVIYPDAVLDVDEIEKAQNLGLEVVGKYEDRDVFLLPCRHHNCTANECLIYETRFNVCRRYRCDLLQQVSRGQMAYEEAALIVETTRKIEMLIGEQLGGRDPAKYLWTQVEDFLASSELVNPADLNQKHAALLVNARALSLLCHRHFESRMHKRINVNDRRREPVTPNPPLPDRQVDS